MNTRNSIAAKPHYAILDGLRGVAALMIVVFHIIDDGFTDTPLDPLYYHGYLAVDFFFLLSGFVIGYAYDDRWGKGLSNKEYFKRRLIRLHPMLFAAAIFGGLCFLLGQTSLVGSPKVSPGILSLAVLLNMFMIPLVPGSRLDPRGWGELFPLNGPVWSLFFEYIGNIFYVYVLHKLPTKALAWCVGLLGAGLAVYTFSPMSGYNFLGVGWTFGEGQLSGGLLRLLFSYSAGMLIARVYHRPATIKGAFWKCALLLVVLLSVPFIGSEGHTIPNAFYDLLCVMVVFPLIIMVGASGAASSRTEGICRFLGDLSYPLYLVHYPILLLFYYWAWGHHYGLMDVIPQAVAFFLATLIAAYLFMKYWDAPVRRHLAGRFLSH